MAALSSVFTSQDPHSKIPWRCPASNSLSLPAPKKLKISHPPAVEDATPPAIRTANLGQSSSGNSPSNMSASKWYENANRTVAQSWKDPADFDTEPPFFISNQALYNPNSQSSSHSEHLFGAVRRDDSENEDLRGVIDDLTIENKRLKQSLRNEKRRRQSSTPNGDRLFEIRMHGMAPEKKRELELLLKNFATSMQSGLIRTHDATASRASANPNANNLPATSLARDPNAKRPPTDSGYGSNSGLASAAHSNGGWSVLPMSQANKDKTVKTYLHDIPDALHPRRPLLMSERSKMALVVRRLEQLFTGKHAVPGEHSQPLQQQEISQSAARADLQADLKKKKKRHIEGTREAHMLPHNSRILDAAERQHSPSKKVDNVKERSESTDSLLSSEASAAPNSGAISPNQRPTRPLDLDIERQIIPSESINYLRHLGLESPHVEDVSSDKEGWMYLNLLNNMAQLHSINVTPEFVRRSIKKRSTKFELSKDGHKVRWIGGPGGTIFSDEEERLLESMNLVPSISTDGILKPSGSSHTSKTASSNAFTPATLSESPRKQMSDSPNQFQLNLATSEWPRGVRQSKTQPASAFDYRPIIFGTKVPRATNSSSMGSSNSSDDSGGTHSNGLVQGSRKSGLKQPHADEGLVIFYSRSQYFCSDFSGDFTALKGRPRRFNDHEAILGVSSGLDDGESPPRYRDACYFTPQSAVDGFDVAEDEIPSFLPSPISAAGQSETEPMELPASGLGGVMPEDNFALDVKVERVHIASPKQRCQHRHSGGRHAKTRYAYRIIETNQFNLQPSQLPSPSYLAFASSSSDAIDTLNMSEDSDDNSSTDEEVEGRMAFGRLSTDYLDDLSEASSDESVDMLRAARAAEPEMVAAQEREFLINQPGGGERVPGSLAVTVGTRSCGPSDGEAIASELDNDDSETGRNE